MMFIFQLLNHKLLQIFVNFVFQNEWCAPLYDIQFMNLFFKRAGVVVLFVLLVFVVIFLSCKYLNLLSFV